VIHIQSTEAGDNDGRVLTASKSYEEEECEVFEIQIQVQRRPWRYEDTAPCAAVITVLQKIETVESGIHCEVKSQSHRCQRDTGLQSP
jgi:hypothetical protein